MNCVNIKSKEFQELLEATKLPSLLLEMRIAKWQEINGLDNFPKVEDIIQSNEIDYNFKAIDILQSEKAKQVFAKGEKAGWTLDKILTELQIPKEQKQLILDRGHKVLTNNDARLSNEPDLREQIITDLLVNYSYAVEINTAKEPKNYDNIAQGFQEVFDYNNEQYFYDEWDGYFKEGVKITKKEFEEAKQKSVSDKPTQHYSNLTVPGGTNYTENEIATPAITPSIKGHAQFATDKGIGWFRSDDRQVNLGGAELSDEYAPDIEQLPNGKWEVSYMPITGGRKLEFFKTEQEAKDFVKSITKTSDVKTRRILEVQSDLFQKGRDKKDLVNLEKERNRELNKKLDSGEITEEEYYNIVDNKNTIPINSKTNQFLQLLNKDNNWVTFFVKSIIQDSAKKGYEKVLFPSGDTASKVEGHTTLEEYKKQKEDRIETLENENKGRYIVISANNQRDIFTTEQRAKEVVEFYNKEIDEDDAFAVKSYYEYRPLQEEILEANNKEIAQLKQELERVETEGFGALKPIYNFYENTVNNILKKQGYNPQVITDEYGNKWNEININKELKNPIILRQKNRVIDNNIDNTNNKVLKKLLQLPTKSNFISNLLDDYNSSTEDSIDITNRKIELMQQGLNAVVLIDTSIEDSGQLLPSNHPISKQYDKPVILINPDKLFSDTVFHEFGHLYIDLLGIEDPLVKQAIELLKDSELFEEIKSKYPELSEEDLNKEVLATALGLTVDKVFKRDIENMSLWGKIKNAILTAISKLLGLNNNSLEKLAKEMLSGKTRLTGAESFNSLITQRSKFKLDKSNPNKQQATLDVFKSMSKRVNKVEDLNDRFYEDTETEEIYRDSVTTYKKKFLSNTQRNRGDFDIIFDASEYTRDNIEEHLNNNKISAPLAKALDNYVNNRLSISSPFQLNEGEYFWNQVYDRIILETGSPIDTWKQEAMASIGLENDFIYNVKNDLAYILEEAEKIKNLWEQAPIAGTIVHKIVEDYINGEISEFPNNINDSDDKLLNTIKNIIDTGKKNGSVFLTEQILLSESKGIPGTADLIEVLKDGTVRIYDFKTIRNLNRNNKPKTDIELVKYPGYGHQLVIYGAIINESGIELTQENPYNILFAEIKYSGEVDPNSEIEITDTKLIDLSNKYYLSELLRVQREVLRDFASSDLLEELNLKSDIEDLNDLTNEIFQALRTFEVLTKNMRTTLDTSHIRKLYEDLKKENAGTIDEYVSKDNEVAIKSFIETIYNSLSILELQKPQLGDIVASDFLNNLEYVLQAADKLQDVKAFLLENPNVLVDNKQVILNTINRTIELINSNKDYYKEKLKVGSINILAQNSNLMEGVHREVYELELKAQNPEAWKKLSRDEKNKKINDKLEANKSVLKFKEYQFWKNQYENGILDIRTLEKYMADPSMDKSQIVQIVKNIMDKMDNRVRSEMMNIVPEIVDWYDTLKYDKNKSPKERWSHLFVDETYIDIYGKKQKVKTRRIIQDTTSDYLDVILKYQYQDNYYNKEISRLNNSKTKLSPEQDKLLLELKNKLEKLREDKYVELSKLTKSKGDLQYEVRSNPEYDKLSKQDKEFLEEVKKHLNEADERLYDTPDKKLTKSYKDGNKVFYIPAYRMTDAEAIKSGKFIDRNMSKLRDMVKPPADEDELGITDLEYENKPSLDIANNEYYTIPIFYRNDLEDPSLQSFDIPSLLVMNHETTLHYREAKAIDADLFVILNSVSSKNNNKIKKTDNFLNKDIRSKLGNKIQQSEDNNLFTAVKSSIDNRLYKRSYVGSFTSGVNYKFIKAVDSMGEYSRILALMGGFKSALTTGMQGTVYRFIEGLVGENFTMEDYKKGTTKTYKDLGNLISDTQKYAPTSKTNLLIKKFGLENQLQSLTNKFVQDNFAYKNLDKNTLYSVTSIAETLVTAQLMYSITNSIKALDADGDYIDINGNKTTKDKAITIDEAYTVEKGRLVLNKNVVYTTNNINSKYFTPIEKDVTFASTELSSKIRSIYADLYGQYNQSLKSHVQRTVIGRQLMSLRNWLPRGLHRRWRGFSDVIGNNFMDFEELRDLENFDKRFYTQDQKRFQEGHYVTSIRLFRSILKDMKENQMSLASYFNIRKKLINNQLTDHEIANLKRTQIELALVALTMILAMALRAMAKSYEGDDEDKEKIYMTAYLSYRLNDEISTFINPLAMAKMLANPAVGLSTIERIGKFGNQLIGISYSDEDGWTPNAFEIYERGPKEGYNKAYIKGMNLVPGYVNAQQLLSIIGSEGTHKIEDVYKNIERN